MLTRLSLRIKLTALVVLVVAVSSATFGQLMYNGLADLIDKIVGLRAETVAAAIAEDVGGGWFKYISIQDGGDEEYSRLEGRVLRLVQKGYVNRVEFVRPLDRSRAERVLSVPADDSPDYYAPGSTERVEPGDLYAMRAADHHGLEMKAGKFMAGWAPILEGDEQVGLVAVYIDGRETNHFIATANLAILIAMVVFVLLSGLVAFKFATTFEKTAVTDGLMGIYNHKFFKQRLEQEVEKSRRYGQQTTLVLLDIDFFKRVNDTYGHATGDLVLKSLAKWVTDSSRTTDVVARYGGEEIAIILPHTGVAGAQEFAERLRLKVSHQVVRDPQEDAEFRVTVSVGVGQWEKGMDMLDLIKHTDAALYHSKHTGRNRVSLYQEELLPPPNQLPPAANH